MVCNVRLPSRRGGWRSRERGAVGRCAAVRGFHGALDQVVSQDSKWLFRCFVCAAWWALALVFCRSAYAAPSVEVDGNFAGYENGETYNGYIVVDAPNEYIATLALIGEYSSLVQIDSDMYAKLSNESSGGRFYELVQQWQKLGTNASGTSNNYPTWAGSTYFMDGLVTVYGYGRVWECAITDALKAGAKQDFLTILGGGSLGGGSGGGDVDYGSYDGTTYTLECVKGGGTDIYITPNSSMSTVISSYLADDAKIAIVYNGIDLGDYWAPRKYSASGHVYKITSDFELIIEDNEVYIKNITNSNKTLFYYGGTAGSMLDENDYVVNFSNQSSRTYTVNRGATYKVSTTQKYSWVYGGSGIADEGGSGGDDEPGDNNWPDDDTPQPPSPNPPTPTTPDPDPGPTLPPIDPHDPVIPGVPTIEPEPTGTTPTDYTPWLRAILQQLVNLTSYLEPFLSYIGNALDDHCQHIRDHMTTCFNWLGEYVITGMSNLLGDHHTFLNGLAQWIVDNLRWENSGGEFDDSNMIYWLRRIYARQGSGDVNSRPVDPATDYGAFSGWLGILYDELALDVSDTSLVALSASLSGLQHTFPFSLPWDIRQVLQALDVSPVTPSATFTIPKWGYVEGSFTIDAEPYNRYTYDIDLHWMDSAMVSVRAFELLVFIVYVMVHTKDLFGYLMGE